MPTSAGVVATCPRCGEPEPLYEPIPGAGWYCQVCSYTAPARTAEPTPRDLGSPGLPHRRGAARVGSAA